MEFLCISEFGKRIGVTAVTLRKWEERGLLKPHHKSPTGYRYYSTKQVEDYFNGRINAKGGDL